MTSDSKMIPTSANIARDTVTAITINTTNIKARGQISDALQLGTWASQIFTTFQEFGHIKCVKSFRTF